MTNQILRKARETKLKPITMEKPRVLVEVKKISQFQTLKDLLVKQGRSEIFKASRPEVLIVINVRTNNYLQFAIENSLNGIQFKSFFEDKELFTITESAEYTFKLTGKVLFTRIYFHSGEGELDITFTSKSLK